MRSRKNESYSFEYKLHVVELYLSSEVSYQELASLLITKWVNDFRIAGPDVLRPKKKGRNKSLDSKKVNTDVTQAEDITPVDTSAEHVKQLEDILAVVMMNIRIMQKLRLQVTLYLDPFLDMFNGEIISYGISRSPSAVSVLSAQKKAIEITSDCPYRRTFHSDRGWAYQMPAYSNELKENRNLVG